MTKIPSISVIMSCYNEAAVVARAIESILNQTFSDFEFIIVDDASTDGTYEVCQEYAAKDERVRLFRMEENSGSCTRPLNLAIEQSTAPILARMDADDVSYATRFQQQYDFLLTHPEVDILGTGIRLMDKDTGKLLGTYYYEETHEYIVRKRYRRPFLAHPTVMLRREVYSGFGGYDLLLRRGQDTDLWLKSFQKFRFHNLQEVLLDYYRSSISIGNRDVKELRNNLAIKYGAMRNNKEIGRYWLFPLVDILYFLVGSVLFLFSKK